MNHNIINVNDADMPAFYPFISLTKEEMSNTALLGAVDGEGLPAGILAYTVNKSVIQVMDFYVDEKYRGQGIGHALLTALEEIDEASRENYPIQILYPDDEYHSGLDALLGKRPWFTVLKRDSLHTISPEMIKSSPQVARLISYRIPVKPFFSISPYTRNKLYSEMHEEGRSLLYGMERDDFIKPLSLCRVRGGEICAGILSRSISEDSIEAYYVFCKKGAELDLAAVLGAFFRITEKRFADRSLVISTINKASKRLTAHLFPDAETESINIAVSFGRFQQI